MVMGREPWQYYDRVPSDCESLAVFVDMPSNQYHPGDLFYCDAILCNQTGWNLNDAALFLIFEYAGEYYFGPSFSQAIDTYYSEYPTFAQGKTTIPILPAFRWSSGLGSASGVRFYAGLTDPRITTLYGEYGMFEFGWAE
jgi:hypothetical protein